jgi:hypothetical protein
VRSEGSNKGEREETGGVGLDLQIAIEVFEATVDAIALAVNSTYSVARG